MKSLQKTVKIARRFTRKPRGWCRTVILGEEGERAHAIKKGLLCLAVSLFVGSILRGVLKSGGEPLGDLKLAEAKALQEAPSPYKAGPYVEGGTSAKSMGQRKIKPQSYVGLELFQRPALPIPAGLLVQAKLVTGASSGPVEVKLIENGVVRGTTVVDSGSSLFGVASSSDERLVIRFAKLRKEDGLEENVQAQAYDLDDKTAGLKPSRIWHETKKFLYTGGLNFAAGLAEGLQDTNVSNGVAVKASNLKNGLLNGAKDAARSQSQEILSGMRSKPPAMELPPDTVFYVGFE
jgi:hypothetical protein